MTPKTLKTKAPKRNQKHIAGAMADRMGRAELVRALHEGSGLTLKDTKVVVDVFTDVITKALADGKTVALKHIGSLSVVNTAERQGVNPMNSSKITIPAGRRVRFKVATDLKRNLN